MCWGRPSPAGSLPWASPRRRQERGARVVTTGLGWYQRLAKYAGAGTLVPITGFANAMSSPAIEFKSEGMVLGLAAKLFVIAGPVIVYGTAASILYGLVLVIIAPG